MSTGVDAATGLEEAAEEEVDAGVCACPGVALEESDPCFFVMVASIC
jgi:hypothetical protein